jgi:ribonuclease P protein component
MSQKLPKKLRLCDDRLIERLFKKGKRIQHGVVSFKYLPDEDFQVAFGAPKKRFPKAVERNLLKRKLRESFRLHYRKILGEEPSGYGYFVFNGTTETSFQEINKAMVEVLNSWKAL